MIVWMVEIGRGIGEVVNAPRRREASSHGEGERRKTKEIK
jgi:hypothetical protein